MRLGLRPRAVRLRSPQNVFLPRSYSMAALRVLILGRTKRAGYLASPGATHCLGQSSEMARVWLEAASSRMSMYLARGLCLRS